MNGFVAEPHEMGWRVDIRYHPVLKAGISSPVLFSQRRNALFNVVAVDPEPDLRGESVGRGSALPRQSWWSCARSEPASGVSRAEWARWCEFACVVR